MSAAEHVVVVDTLPFGGSRWVKEGCIVRATCSCGRNAESGDNYGGIPLDEVEAHLRRSLRAMHESREFGAP